MTSWLTEEDEYVCPLSKDTQRVAKEELRETLSVREQSLSQLRDWIKTNPKITNCRLDANFLLRFLRAKKFSVMQAGEAVETYLLLRHAGSIAFRNLGLTATLNKADTKEYKTIDELVSRGVAFAVPGRDSKGRRVVVARPGAFDPHKYTKEDVCLIAGVTAETLMEDEENQVRGFVYFADGAGVSFPHITLFTPLEAVRIAKNGERTLPMRHKEVHGFNVNLSVKFALEFGMSLVSDKIKQRVKIYRSLAEAQRSIDTKMLPKEYGGVMPMAEMIDLWKQELKAAIPKLLANDKMSVCLEMFTEQARVGSVRALRNGARCRSNDNGIMGVSGTFRKLELD